MCLHRGVVGALKMKDPIELTLELDKQMLTLATAVLAQTVGFVKDVLRVKANNIPWQIKAAWVCNFASISCGMWLLGVLATTANKCNQNPGCEKSNVFGDNYNIVTSGSLQGSFFTLGMFFILLYGFTALRPLSNGQCEQPDKSGEGEPEKGTSKELASDDITARLSE
jgi:hypothetical protein